MLLLGRAKDQGITIFHKGIQIAHIVVTDIQRGKVKLGLTANHDVIFSRDELLIENGIEAVIKKSEEMIKQK